MNPSHNVGHQTKSMLTFWLWYTVALARIGELKLHGKNAEPMDCRYDNGLLLKIEDIGFF